MKKMTAFSLAVLMGLASAPAFAQDNPPPPPPEDGQGPGGPGGPGGPHRFFKDADGNNDGFLTKDEMRKAQDKRLDKMFQMTDTNKDGKLSKEELKEGHEKMRAKMRERFEKRRQEQ